MTTKHSPTPYTIQPMQDNYHGYSDWHTLNIRDARNCHVLTIGEIDHLTGIEAQETAAFIALACNEYEHLTAALDRSAEHVNELERLIVDKNAHIAELEDITRNLSNHLERILYIAEHAAEYTDELRAIAKHAEAFNVLEAVDFQTRKAQG